MERSGWGGGGQRQAKHHEAPTSKNNFPDTNSSPQKTHHKQWYLMRVSQRWPCGFLLLGGTCIFSQGFFSRSDREGVKLLSSRSQQGRTTHWGWRRHSYLPLHAFGKHAHKNTYQSRGVRVLFSRQNALIWKVFLHAKTHWGRNIIKLSGFMNEPHIYLKEKRWQWKRRDYRCLLRG